MIFVACAAALLVVAGVCLLFARTRPRAADYEEMEARRRAIEALDRI